MTSISEVDLDVELWLEIELELEQDPQDELVEQLEEEKENAHEHEEQEDDNDGDQQEEYGEEREHEDRGMPDPWVIESRGSHVLACRMALNWLAVYTEDATWTVGPWFGKRQIRAISSAITPNVRSFVQKSQKR